MTDKEFKRLNRSQLIDIIYQLQIKQDEISEENESLKKALADKRLRINESGSIAEAALEINDCFKNAQKAADQYLEEIRSIRAEIENERQRIISEAVEEAAAIISHAKNTSVCSEDSDGLLSTYTEPDESGEGSVL